MKGVCELTEVLRKGHQDMCGCKGAEEFCIKEFVFVMC